MKNEEIIKNIEEAKNKFYPDFKGVPVLWRSNYTDPISNKKCFYEDLGECVMIYNDGSESHSNLTEEDDEFENSQGYESRKYHCTFRSIEHILYSNTDNKIYVIISYPAIIESCDDGPYDIRVKDIQKTVIIDKDILGNLYDKTIFDKYFLFEEL